MENLLLEIGQNYGLNLHFVEKVTKGFLSENYILTDGTKKFFLKKYRFDKKERIEEIHLVKRYFSERGIPVILPINLQSEDTFFFYDGGYYTLFPFVEGKQFERGDLTETAIVSLGKMLGNIHLQGKDAIVKLEKYFSLKFENKEVILQKIESILKIINDKEQQGEFDVVARKNLELKQRLILSNDLQNKDIKLEANHLIHGDYLDSNVFFDKNDEVSYVFDFEKTSYTPRVFELLRSMMYSLLYTNITEKDLEKCKLYIESYSSIYPISDEELLHGLQLFKIQSLYGLWVEEEHYLKNNYRVDLFLYSDFIRNTYFEEHYTTLEKALLQND